MRPVKPLLLGMTYKDEVEIVLPVLLYSLFLPLMVEREFVAAVSLTWPSDSVVSSSLAVKATLASEELQAACQRTELQAEFLLQLTVVREEPLVIEPLESGQKFRRGSWQFLVVTSRVCELPPRTAHGSR